MVVCLCLCLSLERPGKCSPKPIFAGRRFQLPPCAVVMMDHTPSTDDMPDKNMHHNRSRNTFISKTLFILHWSGVPYMTTTPAICMHNLITNGKRLRPHLFTLELMRYVCYMYTIVVVCNNILYATIPCPYENALCFRALCFRACASAACVGKDILDASEQPRELGHQTDCLPTSLTILYALCGQTCARRRVVKHAIKNVAQKNTHIATRTNNVLRSPTHIQAQMVCVRVFVGL